MPLLIDCYNVLHTTMPSSLAGLDEAGLCRALDRSGFAGDRIAVVCDGRVKPQGPEVSPVAGIELIYSGTGRTADQVIIDLIDRDTAPRRLIVVSSDREIQKAARRRRAKVLSSSQFIGVLARPGSEADRSARPTVSLGADQVEAWLEEFGLDGDEPIGPHLTWDEFIDES